MANFETLLFDYFSRLERKIRLTPLNLGAISASGGGAGMPPGGFIGYLPQTRVAYDYTEDGTLFIPISGMSLLDNLNHIRFRLSVLEASGVGGAGTLSFYEDGILIASGVTIVDFQSPLEVDEIIPGRVEITMPDQTFLALTDTPASYAGQSGKSVTVKNTEDGLEFITISGGSDTDEKTKVSSNDTTADYLENKIVAGDNVSLAVLNEGGNEQLEITASGGGGSDTFEVKISADDTTENFIESKIVAGTAIDLTVLNPGGNEQLEISVEANATDKVKISSNDIAANYLENKINAGNAIALTTLFEAGNEQLQINTNLTVKESDNNPTISGVNTIVFDNNGVLEDLGSGVVQVTISGGGGNPDIGARVYNSEGYQISNGTPTVLTFDTERWDTDSIHSTSSNTSRLTCNTAGKYLIGANIEWEDAGLGGERSISIRLNNSFNIAKVVDLGDTGGISHVQNISTIYDLAVTDYVEVVADQSSGSDIFIYHTLRYSPEFWIQKLA